MHFEKHPIELADRVAFPGPDNLPRLIASVRLLEHETVFAMTVYKGQGLEFDTVSSGSVGY